MARNGTSIAMQNQVLALKTQGKGVRAIARALQLSRNTVRSILRQTPVVDSLSVEILPIVERWVKAVDWDEVIKARKLGRTITQLHVVHAPDGVSYWAFRRELNRRTASTPKPAARLEHTPAEKTFIDYADGIILVDPVSGKCTKTHLFCGVLPYSGKVFAEFVFDQKLPSFLSSHEKMWSYFGGVTPYVVCDNLKSGVTKAHRYDPDVNPTYCEFGNHCGFAVLPARPFCPRDKAAVEAAIGVIQKTFFQEVADRSFYSLDELNLVFRQYLERLNAHVMKDYGVSRNERFAIEQPLLLPLPTKSFERSEWKDATVHPDCHIQVQKNFYSVPFQRVGQEVRVRIGNTLIEVFTQDLELICAHPRQEGVGRSKTDDAHMPPHAMQASSFEIRSNIAKAKAIGPKAAELADLLLVKTSRPLRRLRMFQGLTRLVKDGRVSREAMEYAASQALTFRRYRLAYLTDCALSFDRRGPRPQVVAPQREAEHIHLHGGTRE